MAKNWGSCRGFAAFGLSYRDVAKRAVDGLVNGTSGKVTRDRIHGNALVPEGSAHGGWQSNPDQAVSMTQCFGCWTLCGIRVRVNRAENKVLRIAGNPWHPLSHEKPFDSMMPFSEALQKMAGKAGLNPALPPARAAPLCWRACTARCVFLRR
jgi:tetrathionate reductase subunit A